MKIKNLFYKRPSIRIASRYSATVCFVIILFAVVMPRLLHYGPESINTPFDIQMSYIPYWVQYLFIGLLLVGSAFFFTCIAFRDVDKFYLSKDPNKYNDVKLIKKVRKKCFRLPLSIPAFEVFIPAACALSVLIFTGSHVSVMLIKVLIAILAFSIILAVLSYIFSKKIYNEVLTKTYKEDLNTGLRLNLKTKMMLQLSPLILFCILILTFIAFSFTVRAKEDIYFNVYNNLVNDSFSENEIYSYSEINSKLNSIKLFDDSHTKFIIKPDNSVVTLNGTEPSYFLQEYTKQIAQKYEGRTYDSYGVDTQGKTMKIKSYDDTYYYIGITYDMNYKDFLPLLIFYAVLLIAISMTILSVFSRSMTKDIAEISESFERLCLNDFGKTLPVTTNDEIGDLIHSFNSVQRYSQKQVELLKSNQEVLMEKERLATLGQMVGGIAHNLKTPIMSISGASEGLKDLINEYDKSIEDSDVTVQDHHEIAHDMRSWIEKINSYTEYMSDIITAVKGQAVTLSNQEIVSFTVNELVKRVQILMKHELKHSLIGLNINMNVDENLELHGDINSLVQVLNNLISNAIQAYDGAENQKIDFDLNMDRNNLVISITDYGKGIPEDIQKRLFKEMVTTKGKNGTGLGLFMSYSNIRAHFNGNMRFESEVGKGTTFEIVLPV